MALSIPELESGSRLPVSKSSQENTSFVEKDENEIANGAIVLDTRHQDIFEKGFVPGSVFVGLNGRFAEWVGTILNIDTKLVIVADTGKEEESILRLARVGYENVKGYLNGGFDAWKNAGKKIDMLISIEPAEMELDLKFEKPLVMDVRKENEFEAGHVVDAENVVLQSFDKDLASSGIKPSQNIYVHCQGGYRSVIAASIMKRHGLHNLRNVLGGWSAISAVPDMPIVVPSKNAELN